MDLTPIFRIEKFLDAIVNSTTPPEPVFREEFFLAKIAGADVTTPEPIFRIEKYLAKIAGEDVEIPEPKFRIEFWLAKIAGMDVETPTPIFRVEFWLEEWSGGEVDPLITLTGRIIRFFSREAKPMVKIEAEFSPVQDLHGYEAPWPPGGGKNKLPLPTAETKNGVTLVHNANGSVTITGTASTNTYFDFFAGDFDSTAFAGYKFTSGLSSAVTGISFRVSESNRVALQDIGVNATISDNGSSLYFAIRVNTGTVLPTGGLTIYPMLSQDGGDFAPYSNECPISGWTGATVQRTGKNLWKFDSSYTASGAGSFIPVDDTRAFPLKAGTYTLSFSADTSNMNTIQFGFVNADNTRTQISYYCKNVASPSYTFTLAQDVKVLRNAYSNTALSISNFQLELGSTASSYEPYSGTSVSLTFGSTVYGGQATDNGDGTWTVSLTKQIVSKAWSRSSQYNHVFYVNGVGNKTFPTAQKSDAISNLLPTVQANSLTLFDAYDYGVRVTDIVYAVNKDCSTAAEFNAWATANGLQVVYTLAEPITFTVSGGTLSSLVGVNTVWADTNGDTTIEVYGTPIT